MRVEMKVNPHISENQDIFGIYMNTIGITHEDEITCLELHFDNKITWKHHITQERKQIYLLLKQLNWLNR